MKNILVFIFASIALLSVTSCSDQGDEYGYVIKDGMAIYKTPARPAGQTSIPDFTRGEWDNLDGLKLQIKEMENI